MSIWFPNFVLLRYVWTSSQLCIFIRKNQNGCFWKSGTPTLMMITFPVNLTTNSKHVSHYKSRLFPKHFKHMNISLGQMTLYTHYPYSWHPAEQKKHIQHPYPHSIDLYERWVMDILRGCPQKGLIYVYISTHSISVLINIIYTHHRIYLYPHSKWPILRIHGTLKSIVLSALSLQHSVLS